MTCFRALFLVACAAALGSSPLAQAQDYYYDGDGYDGYDDRYANDGDRFLAPTYQRDYEDDYSNDAILHDRVHRAIERALGPDAYGIRVDVRGGHAYLSGTVRDRRARRIAHDVAHRVHGIHGVFAARLHVGRRWY